MYHKIHDCKGVYIAVTTLDSEFNTFGKKNHLVNELRANAFAIKINWSDEDGRWRYCIAIWSLLWSTKNIAAVLYASRSSRRTLLVMICRPTSATTHLSELPWPLPIMTSCPRTMLSVLAMVKQQYNISNLHIVDCNQPAMDPSAAKEPEAQWHMGLESPFLSRFQWSDLMGSSYS